MVDKVNNNYGFNYKNMGLTIRFTIYNLWLTEMVHKG